MSTLRFADELRHAVITGHKTATVRLPDEHGVDILEPVDFVDENDEVFAEGHVPTIVTTTVQDAVTVMDNLNAVHSAPDTRSLVRTLNGYYTREVDAATTVDILLLRLREVHLE